MFRHRDKIYAAEISRLSGEPVWPHRRSWTREWRSCSVPTKSKLVYLPPAQHDFEEIVKGIILRRRGTPYARKIYATMKTAINRLRDFPLMGQTHPDPILAANGYRKLVLTKTYVAVYKVIGDTVYIYAIVNGTTDYPRLLK